MKRSWPVELLLLLFLSKPLVFALWPSRRVEYPGAVRAIDSVVRVRVFDVLRPWSRGHGSGFVWDRQGHIVTNHHVVRDALRVSVEFRSGEERPARVVGGSPECDLAVLRVEGPPVRPLRPQRRLPRVGQRVVTVGHPSHWAWMVDSGTITGVGRQSSRGLKRIASRGSMKRFQERCAADGLVFSSALSGPGSSGGPMLSPDGEVVGVTTWLYHGLATPYISAAVSAEVLWRVVPSLVAVGEYALPTVGFERHLGRARVGWTPLFGVRSEGAIVGGGLDEQAAEAGLLRGDEILRIRTAGRWTDVRHGADVVEAVQRGAPGSKLAVAYRRRSDRPGAPARRAELRMRRRSPRSALLRRAGTGARLLLRAYVFGKAVKNLVRVAKEASEDAVSSFQGSTLVAKTVVQKPPGPIQLLRLAVHYVLAGLPEAVCGSFVAGKACRSGGASRSWRSIKTSTLCRRKCETQAPSSSSASCCSFDSNEQICTFVSQSNATNPFQPKPSSVAAVCHAFCPSRALERSRQLLNTLLRIFVDGP